MLTHIGQPGPDTGETAIGALKGTLSILPGELKQSGISVSFAHKLFLGSTETIAPSITFSRTMPWESHIFWVIETGDLDTLKDMLHRREAYLSDRDEEGRCLLHVRQIVKCIFARCSRIT